MKFASIDIGTNTILLLLAEAEVSSPFFIFNDINYYHMPRLGKGLLPEHPVSADRVNLMTKILTEYSAQITSFGCDKVLVNATNAFRIASNRAELASIVENRLGVKPEVIPGTREAFLSHLGAVSSRLTEFETGAVIDIGGGSTEITIGGREKITFSHSFDFGVVSLSEKYFAGSIPQNSEIDSLQKEVRTKLDIIPVSTIDKIVAVAGTPTSLSAIRQNLVNYDEMLIEGSRLNQDDLSRLFQRLKDKSAKELLSDYPNILPGREDLIFSGLLILIEVLKKLKGAEIIVSSRGLRYGAITEYLLNAKYRNNNG